MLSNRKKITWYDLEYIINLDGYLIFLPLFVLFIGHIARYAPSSQRENSLKI